MDTNNNDTFRVAIVTGGSRGIGRATALRLAEGGYAVVVGYSANEAEADKVVAQIEERGGRAVAAGGDVSDGGVVRAMFDTAEQEYGGVDAVVHAAGQMRLAPVAELDLDDLDRTLRVNVRGTFAVAQQAARRLRGPGALVLFSTTVVPLAFPTYGAYSASKGAVEALTPILAKELRGRDVTVNAVAPGPTATDMFLDGKSEEQIAGLAKLPPLERLGTAEDIAAAVAFLVGPDGHWVNGQVLRANGGII
ncbi:SDR family oxidoreductase [Nocardioides sp. T2.26MG-1]|uniref:SDR family oxidoreductase n=1 Tax=Nocardioides sp. T2.26MG-1 TaxID=3041166 RepID=UPI00247797A5|nr:SDR family oxidoreductase [Nocardioides sp. T2.26MG-1]CAI9416228.1 3-oxoacyl-[acyl-carrier-protein] reductase FabG [Nocardioides sp. T2.26MG-1]